MNLKELNWKPITDIIVEDIGKFVILKRDGKPVSFDIYQITDIEKLTLKSKKGKSTAFINEKERFVFLYEVNCYDHSHTIKNGNKIQYDNAIFNSFLTGISSIIEAIMFNECPYSLLNDNKGR